MTTNAARYFTAQPAPGGGVTLKPRYRFRDQFAIEPQLVTEIDPDGVARSRPDTSENGDELLENTVHVFGPLAPGQTAKLVQNDNGTIAVVLVSQPDEVLGNSLETGGVTTDRRSAYLAQSYGRGSEAQQLARINQIQREHFKR